ncbi:MAG TPA: shikimate dehydrogenase [Verrucomicrobiae bacterium]|nr:shikimate dehydrogenase [Verrucomicrobiae bacterium]
MADGSEWMQSGQQSAIDLLSKVIAGHAELDGSRRRPVLVGLLGRGIQSSRSPVMHQREGARLGMRFTYALVDFDRLGLPDSMLGEVIAGAEQLGFAGVNVTHPFKQSVIAHLADLSPEAADIGAVNTVVFDNGRRIGHNTDCWGFAESFYEHMGGCPLDSVLQFGAGGGGAAVAHALLELGVGELALFDIDGSRSEQLARRLAVRFGGVITPVTELQPALACVSGIVNTTPIGMDKYPGVPFPTDLLESRHWVADIVYFPQETELLRLARGLGCRTIAGAGMAVYQAVKAFELFTGVAPDRTAMTLHFGAAA